ncbi:amidase [Altererythrobacter sp.]|nr:amidase [Altererythrobacter sp.]
MKTFLPLTALALIALPAIPAIAQNSAPAVTTPASTAEKAAKDQLSRISLLDDAGPRLNAVIAVNPDAPQQARLAEQAGQPLGGKTVLIKDNIETRELPTTAGSLALKDNMTGRDAPLVARLRAAGGVVIGKANLSEWANIRDNASTSGWSAVGGLTRNPFAIDRNTCGSSSGSGAGVAAGFAWAAIGTETNGSITCPASINGIVGFKPTVGMVSRTHVVPISSTQDTAGPMARDVASAAMLMNAIAGTDPADAATAEADQRKTDFTNGLEDASLAGIRIGVMRKQVGNRADVRTVFDQALADMQAAGAQLIDIEFDVNSKVYGDSYTVLLFELREEMGKYLRSLPGEGLPRSLADLIRFNTVNADLEMRWFGQSIFETAEETTDRSAYEEARESAVRIAGKETIDALLAEHDVQFLVAPTRGPSWASDLVVGDNFNGTIGFGAPAAIAGYPHLTVPMGDIEGLPVGLSIIGTRWSDHAVLKVGRAFEKARTAKLPQPTFQRWTPKQ